MAKNGKESTLQMQDPYYNPDKAKAKFAEAKKELEAKGVQFPIHLDVTVDQSSKRCTWSKLFETIHRRSVLGAENVVIDIQQLSTDDYDNSVPRSNCWLKKAFDIYNGGWSHETYAQIRQAILIS